MPLVAELVHLVGDVLHGDVGEGGSVHAGSSEGGDLGGQALDEMPDCHS